MTQLRHPIENNKTNDVVMEAWHCFHLPMTNKIVIENKTTSYRVEAATPRKIGGEITKQQNIITVPHVSYH